MKNRTVLETTGTMEGYAEIEDFLWGDKMKVLGIIESFGSDFSLIICASFEMSIISGTY